MKITNCSFDEALSLSSQENFDLVISITEVNGNAYLPNSNVFYFNDTTNEVNGPNDTHMRRLKEIFEQTRLKENSSVLIHCFAGVSRSSAATLMLLIHHDICKNPVDAVDYLFDEINTSAHPNKWMIEWIIKEYNCPEIRDAIELRKTNRFTRNLTVPFD